MIFVLLWYAPIGRVPVLAVHQPLLPYLSSFTHAVYILIWDLQRRCHYYLKVSMPPHGQRPAGVPFFVWM